MKIFNVCFTLLIVFFFTNSYSQTTSSEVFTKGLEYYYGAKFDEAIKLFDEYVKSMSSDYRGYEYRGLCYQGLKNYQRAIEDFTNVMGVAPKRTEGYINRANTYILLNNLTSALNDFSDALRINSSDIEAYLGRARIYTLQKQYSKAMTDLNTASGIDPLNARVYINKAWVNTLAEDTTEIFNNILKALSYDSNIVFTNYKRELLYIKFENYKNALAIANKKVEMNPESYIAYFSRGMIYFLMNRFDFAKVDFKEAIRLNQIRSDKFIEVMEKILRSIQRNT